MSGKKLTPQPLLMKVNVDHDVVADADRVKYSVNFVTDAVDDTLEPIENGRKPGDIVTHVAWAVDTLAALTANTFLCNVVTSLKLEVAVSDSIIRGLSFMANQEEIEQVVMLFLLGNSVDNTTIRVSREDLC